MIRKKPVTKEAACLRMADLCARAEHSSHEIREKLRRLGLFTHDIDSIIEYLEQNRYIDNSRFAKAFARDKVRFSGWGKNKIRAALAMKRISSSEIREAIEAIEEEDYNNAINRAAAAKAQGLDLNDYAQKAKLFRHLASRGFESSVISKAINRLISNL
ncbi:MAG: RecX family transcriptional regulator [Muribaculaceae bacterium]|nr:RecX family transcriptional regulator [Muribaculaceae bacterium]